MNWLFELCFYAFLLTALIQSLYWGLVFSKFAFHQQRHQKSPSTPKPISVVICAYNEAENLQKHLPSILEQDYPHFDVWVVDDESTDKTSSVLHDFKKEYPHLNVLQMDYPEGKKGLGKKQALAKGIQACQHTHVLVTDADCHPNSEHWISIMASALEEHQIGLGYGPYERRDGFLNLFIQFETIYTAIQYMSFALWRQPYMGVGRNMIYKKELFYQANGFEQHEHLASGDDDLFVNAIANRSNTDIVIDTRSFMYSPPKESWAAYYRQKSRHMTTGRHYRPIHQILLGILSLSHFGFYILGFICLLNGFSIVFAGVIFLSTLLLKTIVFAIIAQKLNERRIIPYFLILDVIYILYYIAFTPALAWGKTEKWK